MKIYISGPITGTNDHAERFRRMEEALVAAGNTVVNPEKVNANLPEGTTHEEYMQTSLAMLNMCEAVMMMKGWQSSEGCNEELCFAEKLGLTIVFEGGRGCQRVDSPEQESSVPKREQRLKPAMGKGAYSARKGIVQKGRPGLIFASSV